MGTPGGGAAQCGVPVGDGRRAAAGVRDGVPGGLRDGPGAVRRRQQGADRLRPGRDAAGPCAAQLRAAVRRGVREARKELRFREPVQTMSCSLIIDQIQVMYGLADAPEHELEGLQLSGRGSATGEARLTMHDWLHANQRINIATALNNRLCGCRGG